ncbi:GTP-binding protein [Streptantibioticus ferralitis]|uniref:ATP/GTP-binding protein n=1 Tax=Streptantibioticus ferralitis TaxID=236510 RepID=A0ABT5YS31_9ACTN|nr:ATP/GTP-binding protein [Streptantibioticus ferralitis]MDF2254404.1 ATP/GTP-binding protein [Streptantibioticus ferralitis]
MDSARSSPDPRYLTGNDPVLIKLLIAGPFAVGKTTLIRAISEIAPLHTEEVMTQAGAFVDNLAEAEHKTTTTVAIDFGRLTLPNNLVLYLFGTPGQRRFRLLWEDIAQGALGALVMVDTRRLDESFEVMDLIEEAGLRYAVAVNAFPQAPTYDLDTLRDHLDLRPDTPLVLCDARSRDQSLDALIALVEHVIAHTHLEPA